ncbi:hypothetical protein OG563_25575 [Nocardia vinacea]|uniref:Wzt C-terminal domain-containing protein n=1 Tax=Nocardia vinacea TaxID=96468 RepID=A0ABZ1YHF9_9NOCA|nr:hypothetical protein [Nocardia vinacea]
MPTPTPTSTKLTQSQSCRPVSSIPKRYDGPEPEALQPSMMPHILAAPAVIHVDSDVRIWHSGLVQGLSRTYFAIIIEAVEPDEKSFPLPVDVILRLQRSMTVTFSRDGVTLPYPMIAGAEDLASMTWFATFPRLDPGTYTIQVDIAELNVHHPKRFEVLEHYVPTELS